MRRLLLIAAVALMARGEIIDRLAVSVGNAAITASEIELQIRVAAFLNRETPVFTPEARRKAADRLIEQRLIEREMQLIRYPAPSEGDIDGLLNDIKKQRPDFAAALAAAGITETDLRNQLRKQLMLLRFIDVRFKPGVQVTEEEIRDYFEKYVQPSNPAGQIDDYWEVIEEKLVDERADKEVDQWLKEARARADIQYHEEVFQ